MLLKAWYNSVLLKLFSLRKSIFEVDEVGIDLATGKMCSENPPSTVLVSIPYPGQRD